MSIHNVGNTCFFSAMVQSVIHTKTLHMYITCRSKYGIDKEDPLSVYMGLHNKVCEGRGACPRKLLEMLGKFDKIFNSCEQQDAHEALLSFLNILRNFTPLTHTLYNFNKHGHIAWNRDKRHNVIDEIFKIQTYVILSCTHCKKSSRHFTNDFGIMIHIPDVKQSIDHIINEQYNQDETLTLTCDHCKTHGSFLKKQRISHYPLALIICIKQKVDMDLKHVFVNRFQIDNKEYELYSITHHIGSTINSGHYTTCVKNKHHWIMKNDSMSYNMHTVHRYFDVHKNGYIFMYHQMNF